MILRSYITSMFHILRTRRKRTRIFHKNTSKNRKFQISLYTATPTFNQMFSCLREKLTHFYKKNVPLCSGRLELQENPKNSIGDFISLVMRYGVLFSLIFFCIIMQLFLSNKYVT